MFLTPVLTRIAFYRKYGMEIAFYLGNEQVFASG